MEWLRALAAFAGIIGAFSKIVTEPVEEFKPTGHDPNNNSIGIKILSIGARTPRPDKYSGEMYTALGALIGGICRRHQLPLQRKTVCGHEDVNPFERWGWDPHQGFDWDRVLQFSRDHRS
jgi:N-acetyl-anhydromuramyl-L-alanine amidase AmpD